MRRIRASSYVLYVRREMAECLKRFKKQKTPRLNSHPFFFVIDSSLPFRSICVSDLGSGKRTPRSLYPLGRYALCFFIGYGYESVLYSVPAHIITQKINVAPCLQNKIPATPRETTRLAGAWTPGPAECRVARISPNNTPYTNLGDRLRTTKIANENRTHFIHEK